jgi:hypothetical protein
MSANTSGSISIRIFTLIPRAGLSTGYRLHLRRCPDCEDDSLNLTQKRSPGAKGVWLMLEAGFDVSIGKLDKAWFVEMRHIARKMVRFGFIAIRPMLRMSRKDLW